MRPQQEFLTGMLHQGGSGLSAKPERYETLNIGFRLCRVERRPAALAAP